MNIMTGKEYKKYITTLKQKNKYKNNRSKCSQGHYHASTGEAYYCDYLFTLKKAGIIKDFQSQVRYELQVCGVKITTHIPDFIVFQKNGKTEVHEFKGCETDVWKIKRRLFKALYPDIEYIVIKG